MKNMYEYKFLEFRKRLLQLQKKINETDDDSFFEYIQNILEEYSNEGWTIFQPTILGSTNGTPMNVIVFIERIKKDKRDDK
jgi:hypothetical protein